jgi:hypothetical protein
MNAISMLLTSAAILSSFVVVGFLVLWLKGIDSIFLPGLGILVTTPLVVLLILILEVTLVLLAAFAKSATVRT